MAAMSAGGLKPPEYLLEFARHFEGVHDGDKKTAVLEPEMCPAGVWTAGYGLVLTDPKTGRQYKGDADRTAAYTEWRRRWPKGLTEPEAVCELERRYARVGARVLAMLEIDATTQQVAALTAFEDNTGGLKGSTLLKKLNRGDIDGAAAQFERWVYGGEPRRVLSGLVRRRAAEKAMFLGGDWRAAANLPPEKVAPQAAAATPMKPLAQSRTVAAAAAGLAAPALAGLDQLAGALAAAQSGVDQAKALTERAGAAADQAAGLAASAQSLTGLTSAAAAPWIVAGLSAAALVYVIWRRFDDYRRGA